MIAARDEVTEESERVALNEPRPWKLQYLL